MFLGLVDFPSGTLPSTYRCLYLGASTYETTSYGHKEPEHRDEEFVWQNVCACLTAHTKFGLKCSGSFFFFFFYKTFSISGT